MVRSVRDRSLWTKTITPGKQYKVTINDVEPDLSMGSGVGAGSGASIKYINTINRRPHTSFGFASTVSRPKGSKEVKDIQKRFAGAPERTKWAFQYYDVSDDPKEQEMHQMYQRTVEGKLHNTYRRGLLD